LPRILQLEQHVADLIAAGEVVQRPASVVKELIENSIDAGAGIITVGITSGGMTYIRVSDNGAGIAPEDARTAFARHATSKLQNAGDLEAIGTLGFRGEALAATAAVSHIELQTRQPGAVEGVRLLVDAGEVLSESPAGCPEGTTVVVRDLFFNTPARLKFMKSDRAEGSAVASVVLRCALSRPDISFRFIKDGSTEYHTPGDSRVDSCIYSLLGRDFESGLISAEISDEAVAVKGFISKPAAARGNRGYQFFFVNGRSVRSVLLQSALEQAYRNTLPSGRFPSCILYITISPGSVDVNVHPAKTEVKFISEKQVFNGVYYAALGVLERLSANAVCSMQNAVLHSEEAAFGKAQSINNEVQTENASIAGRGGFKTMPADDFRKSYVSQPVKTYKPSNSPSPEPPISALRTQAHHDTPLQSQPSAPFSFLPFSHLRVIGEALNVYIIVEYQDSVWFIDKHAAHERIHFDALKNGDYEPMSEALITPVICRLGHEDIAVLLENTALLNKLGFTVESFGEDCAAVRHIPSDIDIGDTEAVLSEICTELRHSGTAIPVQRDNIYRKLACKAAVKAGRASDSRELESLASKVLSGEVSHCPHGRPVTYQLTKTTLDKGMGRV